MANSKGTSVMQCFADCNEAVFCVFDVFTVLEYNVSIISDQVSIIIPQDYFWMETSVSVCLLADRDGPHLTFKIPPCSMQ